MSKPFAGNIHRYRAKDEDKNQVTFENLLFFQLTLVDKGGDESFLDGICFQVNLLFCVLPEKVRITVGIIL